VLGAFTHGREKIAKEEEEFADFSRRARLFHAQKEAKRRKMASQTESGGDRAADCVLMNQ